MRFLFGLLEFKGAGSESDPNAVSTDPPTRLMEELTRLVDSLSFPERNLLELTLFCSIFSPGNVISSNLASLVLENTTMSEALKSLLVVDSDGGIIIGHPLLIYALACLPFFAEFNLDKIREGHDAEAYAKVIKPLAEYADFLLSKMEQKKAAKELGRVLLTAFCKHNLWHPGRSHPTPPLELRHSFLVEVLSMRFGNRANDKSQVPFRREAMIAAKDLFQKYAQICLKRDNQSDEAIVICCTAIRLIQFVAVSCQSEEYINDARNLIHKLQNIGMENHFRVLSCKGDIETCHQQIRVDRFEQKLDRDEWHEAKADIPLSTFKNIENHFQELMTYVKTAENYFAQSYDANCTLPNPNISIIQLWDSIVKHFELVFRDIFSNQWKIAGIKAYLVNKAAGSDSNKLSKNARKKLMKKAETEAPSAESSLTTDINNSKNEAAPCNLSDGDKTSFLFRLIDMLRSSGYLTVSADALETALFAFPLWLHRIRTSIAYVKKEKKDDFFSYSLPKVKHFLCRASHNYRLLFNKPLSDSPLLDDPRTIPFVQFFVTSHFDTSERDNDFLVCILTLSRELENYRRLHEELDDRFFFTLELLCDCYSNFPSNEGVLFMLLQKYRNGNPEAMDMKLWHDNGEEMEKDLLRWATWVEEKRPSYGIAAIHNLVIFYLWKTTSKLVSHKDLWRGKLLDALKRLSATAKLFNFNTENFYTLLPTPATIPFLMVGPSHSIKFDAQRFRGSMKVERRNQSEAIQKVHCFELKLDLPIISDERVNISENVEVFCNIELQHDRLVAFGIKPTEDSFDLCYS